MKNKNGYYIFGALLCVAAVCFGGYVIVNHGFPFSWPTWVSYTFCAFYAIYTLMVFLIPNWKNCSPAAAIILAMDFIALGLIVLSIAYRKLSGTNWYLPAALFLGAAGNFANAYFSLKKKKTDSAE